MTLQTILLEELYNHNEIKQTCLTIMNGVVLDFIENKNDNYRSKATFDIGRYFPRKEGIVPSIILTLIIGDGEFADADANNKTGKIEIRIGFEDKIRKLRFSAWFNTYYKHLQHEVIHAFDLIKSKGNRKSTKGYTKTLLKYYNHEMEFNQSMHKISIHMKENNETLDGKNKLEILKVIEKIDYHFGKALFIYPELYPKFLKRAIREKLLKKEPEHR